MNVSFWGQRKVALDFDDCGANAGASVLGPGSGTHGVSEAESDVWGPVAEATGVHLCGEVCSVALAAFWQLALPSGCLFPRPGFQLSPQPVGSDGLTCKSVRVYFRYSPIRALM